MNKNVKIDSEKYEQLKFEFSFLKKDARKVVGKIDKIDLNYFHGEEFFLHT